MEEGPAVLKSTIGHKSVNNTNKMRSSDVTEMLKSFGEIFLAVMTQH